MRSRIVVALGLGALAMACNVPPTAPTLVRGPSVPAVSTSRPRVWNSRDELAAWVTNGVSSGPATVVGAGDDAVIRIEVPGGSNLDLRSPSFDPPVTDLKTIRLRYRWLDGSGGGYGMNGQYVSIYASLQSPNYQPGRSEPVLFIIVPRGRGEWIEEDFYADAALAPYSAMSATISMCGVCGDSSGKGQLEIDWIALVRLSP